MPTTLAPADDGLTLDAIEARNAALMEFGIVAAVLSGAAAAAAALVHHFRH